jgi:hypothetical protein
MRLGDRDLTGQEGRVTYKRIDGVWAPVLVLGGKIRDPRSERVHVPVRCVQVLLLCSGEVQLVNGTVAKACRQLLHRATNPYGNMPKA